MKLQDITPAEAPGISAMYFSRAEPSEAARLITEPHAVLNEAGLNVDKDTRVEVLLNIPGLGPVEGPYHIGWDVVIIVNNQVVVIGHTGV